MTKSFEKFGGCWRAFGMAGVTSLNRRLTFHVLVFGFPFPIIAVAHTSTTPTGFYHNKAKP